MGALIPPELAAAISQGLGTAGIGASALYAFRRLIGAAVDVPTAHLEKVSQGVRDEKEARSAVSQAVAQAAAQQLIADPELVRRAAERLMRSEVQKQENIEAVVAGAYRDLASDETASEQEPPDEDFLSRFEALASSASTERSRAWFSRALAGKIRQPDSISFGALHVLSILDKTLAEAIEWAAQRTTNGGFMLAEPPYRSGLRLEMIYRAGDVGLFRIDELTKTVVFDDDGHIWVTYGRAACLLKGDAGTSIKVRNWPTTLAGRELLNLCDRTPDAETLDELAGMWKALSGVKAVTYGIGEDDPDTPGRLQVVEPKVI